MSPWLIRAGSWRVRASYISGWAATWAGVVGGAVVLPARLARSSVVTLPAEPGGRMFHRLPYDVPARDWLGPAARAPGPPGSPAPTAEGANVATSAPVAKNPMMTA